MRLWYGLFVIGLLCCLVAIKAATMLYDAIDSQVLEVERQLELNTHKIEEVR